MQTLLLTFLFLVTVVTFYERCNVLAEVTLCLFFFFSSVLMLFLKTAFVGEVVLSLSLSCSVFVANPLVVLWAPWLLGVLTFVCYKSA